MGARRQQKMVPRRMRRRSPLLLLSREELREGVAVGRGNAHVLEHVLLQVGHLRVVRQARQHTELVLRGGWLTLLRLASERLSWPRFIDT